MIKTDVEKFLEELTALTMKYKIKIGGCGCCDSPYLKDEEREGKYSIDATPPRPARPPFPETTEWLFDGLYFDTDEKDD